MLWDKLFFDKVTSEISLHMWEPLISERDRDESLFVFDIQTGINYIFIMKIIRFWVREIINDKEIDITKLVEVAKISFFREETSNFSYIISL